MEDKKKVLSIKDIAAISGVSIATVSRILNKKGRYSPETEKKVLAVVNSYGYVPNQTGKSLREARSHTIGLIVPHHDGKLKLIYLKKIIPSLSATAAIRLKRRLIISAPLPVSA